MSCLPSQFNTFHCWCHYHSNSGVLMRNIFDVNNQIELYLEQIGSACDDILVGYCDIHHIDSHIKTILHANAQLYSELEDTEIPEETVALSVVLDFFDGHHIADNLSMGDVMKLEQALRGWYESIR